MSQPTQEQIYQINHASSIFWEWLRNYSRIPMLSANSDQFGRYLLSAFTELTGCAVPSSTFQHFEFSKLITPPLSSWNCRLFKVWVSNWRQQKNEYTKCTLQLFRKYQPTRYNMCKIDVWKIFRNSSKLTSPFINSGKVDTLPKKLI